MVIVLCAVNMLLVQALGLHFHRHIQADAGDHGTSLHLRDAGMHVHENGVDHHARGDHASHPDEDLEIDPLGAGVSKFSKIWLVAAVLSVVVLCLFVVVPACARAFEPPLRRRLALFSLRPPSNAPPLDPSPA
jgi:hypothetical protein